uniref:Uncharacterized protein n=1 Tax=viral metagenome TaxID=1070528 RepID=A0A6C0M0A8_9ZZZZ
MLINTVANGKNGSNNMTGIKTKQNKLKLKLNSGLYYMNLIIPML